MAPQVMTRICSGGSSQVVDSVSFGAVAPSSKSAVIVVEAVFSGLQSVGNLGVGVMSSNLPDGPSGVLFFDVFDSLDDVVEPSRTFWGVAGEDGTSNVEEVGLRGNMESKYVALMVFAQDKPLDCACVVLKWFFGFSKEE